MRGMKRRGERSVVTLLTPLKYEEDDGRPHGAGGSAKDASLWTAAAADRSILKYVEQVTSMINRAASQWSSDCKTGSCEFTPRPYAAGVAPPSSQKANTVPAVGQ